MNIRNEIKAIIVSSGWSITDIVKATKEKYNIDTTTQNLSNKLSRGTIKYSECKMIADIIGYDIKWIKNENK
jgi:peroxiredoxin family protein